MLPGVPADAAGLKLYFSPVFITADVLLGRKRRAVLHPSASLAACQVFDGDILYLEAE